MKIEVDLLDRDVRYVEDIKDRLNLDNNATALSVSICLAIAVLDLVDRGQLSLKLEEKIDVSKKQ